MSAFRILAAGLAVVLATAAMDGCRKRETKPAPQVAAAASSLQQVAGATESLLRYNSRQLGL